MRVNLVFSIFIVTLPLVAPISVFMLLDFASSSIELVLKVAEAWEVVNDYGDFADTPQQEKEKMLYGKIDTVNMKLDDLSERINQIDGALRTINRMVNNLPRRIRQEIYSNNLLTYQVYIDIYYRNLQRYVSNFEDYENITLTNFADEVVAANPNSVMSLINIMYGYITSSNYLQLNFEQFSDTSGDIFCNSKQAPQQMFLNFLERFLQTHAKSYIAIQFAYMVKKLYGQGNFTQEALDATEEFKTRTDTMISFVKYYISSSSRELWRCDPNRHVEGETYVSITNLIRGYFINKENLSPKGECYDGCEDFSHKKDSIKCGNNKWCEKSSPTCHKILECENMDTDMAVCLGDQTHRRYMYIEQGNGKRLGEKTSCNKNKMYKLESFRFRILWKCSTCFCLCDEGPKFYSDRYINLRAAVSHINDNKVVTGLRFVKKNRIIHLQIQEGLLLPKGQIDKKSVHWVPVENYKTTDRNRYPGQDYHELTWQDRGLDLLTVMVPNGSLVTGVRFRRIGQRVELEVLTTPFNFTTGKLQKQRSQYIDHHNKLRHKFGKELKLERPDISTRAKAQSVPNSSGDYVRFTNTDIQKDAAQTTVPFFDAQPVESMIPVPLSGVGVFHKGQKGFGGFIAPKIIIYDYGKHLGPVFNQNNENDS